MAEIAAPPQRDVDADLVEAADDLESLPGELAALLDADGVQTNPDLRDGLLDVREAAIDVFRLARATGHVGLRAKARAILAEGVLDGTPASIELMRMFAEDVLRIVSDDTTNNQPAT